MPKRILQIAAIIAFTSSVFWPAAAHAKWIRAETKHFNFYSSGSLSQLKDFAVETEKFDAILRRRFSIPEDEIISRLTIYVLPSARQVSQLKGVNYLGGFYQSDEEGSYAVASRERPSNLRYQSGMEILFHEYTHHFFARHLPLAYPQWLTEGFAEYYSTVQFESDGTYIVGKIPAGRAYGLVEGRNLPIRRVLLEGLTEELDREERDIFYGRSWLLVHKLMSSDQGREQLANYITDFNSIASKEAVAEDNFGDLDELDRELEKLVRVNIPMFKHSGVPIDFDAHFTSRELADLEGDLIELQLERLAGVTPQETRDKLRNLASQNPNRADVLSELAHAEYRLWAESQDDETEALALTAAETAADAALAIDKGNVRANVLKAKLMTERVGANATEQDIKALRQYLVVANRADPLDPLPLFEYFRSFAEFGQSPPEIAIDGLAQSYFQAPEVVNFRVGLAYAYANKGNFDSAKQLVRHLVYHPHYAEEGQRLLSQMTEMEMNWQLRELRSQQHDEELDRDWETEGQTDLNPAPAPATSP